MLFKYLRLHLIDLSIAANAYVSGMKQDLHFQGADYNLLSTFFIIGYVMGQVPSQMVLTRGNSYNVPSWHQISQKYLDAKNNPVRPSYWLPTCELLWSIVTFCFAAVQNVRDVFALRIVMGFLEAPFAVGVLTIMGSWYTPRGKILSPPKYPRSESSPADEFSAELSKRIAIFYSACYAASMFSGYLQAGIYKGMEGHLGLAGWRWLFIFCGIISLPFSLYGYIAIPDNPYNSKAFWMTPSQLDFARKRMEACDRRPPVLLSWAKMRRIFTHWPLYAFTVIMICQCLVTQPLNYFAIWLQSLHRFSVYQINVIPTAGQAVGLITTLAYSWLADAWGGERRWQALLIPAVVNFVGLIIVSIGPGFGATLFGYLLNGASWGFWPICFVRIHSILLGPPTIIPSFLFASY